MIREGKSTVWLMSVMVLGLLLLSFGPMSVVSTAEAAAEHLATIKVNGKTAKLSDPVLVQDGRMYLPAARIAALAGAEASWDNDNEELTIHTAVNDEVVIGNGVPVVYFNDSRFRMDALPFTRDGRLYAPLRELAELLHASFQSSADGDAIEINVEAQKVVADGYGLNEISKETGISAAQLVKRNGLVSQAAAKNGTKLKVVMPSFLDKPAAPYTEADLTLLAKITMVEAGYESYEGQLAVANVIMNRVNNPAFPDTIKGVIYAGKQFPPAHNGLLDKSKPHASAYRAAKDALNGKSIVGDAVYFFNPARAKGSYFSSMDVVATIGNHSFAQ
ncbi:cell wall hydrolase [Paenibacillus methanolicus]|uniref:Copper amine oxidase-like protein n=1 Tax=Paenibacillus methanolicus TaxID=582686 RepID=A0A5S5C3S0_9BACL|nr:cell wall hydrolase [Paenibacillus methanolicus]TYP74075.1 copper amine oxidase-like protein [Paenibacillus methanolicus]